MVTILSLQCSEENSGNDADYILDEKFVLYDLNQQVSKKKFCILGVWSSPAVRPWVM